MIYIASDHGGFELKEYIKKFLNGKKIPYEDMGPNDLNENDDYPDTLFPAIKKVLEYEENIGILICRNGVGASIFANKFKGIRAALSWREQHAKTSRNDDNANILVLPADYISPDTVTSIVEDFLNTPFSNEERHKRRLEKISQVEK